MPNKENKSVCCLCGEPLAHTEFYKSNSGFYKESHLPICKSCFNEKYGNYSVEYDDKAKAMRRMCMAFDVYYNPELFDKCKKDGEVVLGTYFRMLNMTQNKGKTFEDTLDEEFELAKREKEKGGKVWQIEEEQINPKDIERWGFGFENEDYDILNSHYNLLKSANPNCDSNQEIFIDDLCFTKMQQLKAVREGNVDDYNKLTDSYRKSFKEAGLKTVRDSNINEEFSMGVNAEIIEKYTPAEYYKGKELYKDFDNIGDYISRFLLRPLKNLMHGTKDRDREFYVKDESETDGFTEE